MEGRSYEMKNRTDAEQISCITCSAGQMQDRSYEEQEGCSSGHAEQDVYRTGSGAGQDGCRAG